MGLGQFPSSDSLVNAEFWEESLVLKCFSLWFEERWFESSPVSVTLGKGCFPSPSPDTQPHSSQRSAARCRLSVSGWVRKGGPSGSVSFLLLLPALLLRRSCFITYVLSRKNTFNPFFFLTFPFPNTTVFFLCWFYVSKFWSPCCFCVNYIISPLDL